MKKYFILTRLKKKSGLTYTELLVSIFIASIGTVGLIPFLLIGFEPFEIFGGPNPSEINRIAMNKLQNYYLYTPSEINNISGKMFTEEFNNFKIISRIEPSQTYPDLMMIIVKINWKEWLDKEEKTAVYAIYYNKYQNAF